MPFLEEDGLRLLSMGRHRNAHWVDVSWILIESGTVSGEINFLLLDSRHSC